MVEEKNWLQQTVYWLLDVHSDKQKINVNRKLSTNINQIEKKVKEKNVRQVSPLCGSKALQTRLALNSHRYTCLYFREY